MAVIGTSHSFGTGWTGILNAYNWKLAAAPQHAVLMALQKILSGDSKVENT